MHRGVHFVAGAIKETGVDEDDAVLHGVNARGEVGAGAAFFVHNADLDGMARKTQDVFDGVEQRVGERGFFRAVHLWLHDVDRSGAAVAVGAKVPQVVHRTKGGEQSVENAFGRFASIGQQHRRVGHQMPDIAHEHKAAACQSQVTIFTVGIERAGHRPPALVERGDEIAAHQAEPVGIGCNLVLRIDRRDRIFQIDDGGERGFEDDIGDIELVGCANRVGGINQYLDMQAILIEQITPRLAKLCFRDEMRRRTAR